MLRARCASGVPASVYSATAYALCLDALGRTTDEEHDYIAKRMRCWAWRDPSRFLEESAVPSLAEVLMYLKDLEPPLPPRSPLARYIEEKSPSMYTTIAHSSHWSVDLAKHR